MANDSERFAFSEKQRHWVSKIGEIADRHTDGARIADETNGLNRPLLEELQSIGYCALAVPESSGGLGFSVYDFLLCQERLAQADGPSALALGWHHTTLYDLGQTGEWDRALYRKLCEEVVTGGALINRADSEKATGSPSRGGKPQTTARRSEHGGYALSGRKTFTSLSTALDYFIVSAVDEETGEVAEFLLPHGTPGVSIEETWDMVGMRGTASHDLVMDNAELPASAKAYVRSGAGKPHGNPYLLNIPAVYLGIAGAARNEAVAFAARYQPNSLDKPIAHVPHIREKIGRMELELSAARRFLYGVAAQWDRDKESAPERLPGLRAELAAVKTFAIQTAISVVDTAMRVFGAHGLASSSPMQRHYRDVRFGPSNPPMDDSTLNLLADRALSEVVPEE
ncbi:acyl-CoA dehydrogenase family protein [Paenibacillaceae bacterium WGS1546]|uniref:acyl-CoA dehydrogenase family protein n=1 Tax=Cohnella sp. WGS1546 TaxID=3366810 RepID=UPI00372CFCAF